MRKAIVTLEVEWDDESGQDRPDEWDWSALADCETTLLAFGLMDDEG